MSAISELTTAIKNKLLTLTTIPTVQWAEEVAPDQLTRPKIIVDVVKFRSSGYIDQRTLEWQFYYRIIGYLKKIIPDGQVLNKWTEEDRIAINDLAFEAITKIYSLHDDKQAGIFVLDEFKQFEGECECWVDLELAPGQASFGANIVATVHLSDTESGGST